MQNNLRYQYNMLAPSVKMIIINFAVYILLGLITFLFVLPVNFFNSIFGVPDDLGLLLFRPWSVITYAFLHGGFLHLLFNMLYLYFAGTMFFNLFNGRRFYTIYFLGAIAGALLYIISYNIFPVFTSIGYQSNLIGASAAVMAVIIFLCSYLPNHEIRLFFFLRLKLWHLGVLFVVMDLAQIQMGNAGGHFSHLGGALFGYTYAVQLQRGNDIGAWFEHFMDWIANLFKSSGKTKFKKVYRNPEAQTGKSSKNKGNIKVFDNDKNIQQKKIDAILDKISKSGYESLSKEEKDFLFRAGKN